MAGFTLEEDLHRGTWEILLSVSMAARFTFLPSHLPMAKKLEVRVRRVLPRQFCFEFYLALQV
jgi:hypothetical protein